MKSPGTIYKYKVLKYSKREILESREKRWKIDRRGTSVKSSGRPHQIHYYNTTQLHHYITTYKGECVVSLRTPHGDVLCRRSNQISRKFFFFFFFFFFFSEVNTHTNTRNTGEIRTTLQKVEVTKKLNW